MWNRVYQGSEICSRTQYNEDNFYIPVSGLVFFMESITEIPEQENCLSENGDFVVIIIIRLYILLKI